MAAAHHRKPHQQVEKMTKHGTGDYTRVMSTLILVLALFSRTFAFFSPYCPTFFLLECRSRIMRNARIVSNRIESWAVSPYATGQAPQLSLTSHISHLTSSPPRAKRPRHTCTYSVLRIVPRGTMTIIGVFFFLIKCAVSLFLFLNTPVTLS